MHLNFPPVIYGQPAAQRAEEQTSVLVLGNRHYRQMGHPARQAKGVEVRSVEPAHAAVGRGDPEQPVAVLVDVFHVHPAQPVKDRVVFAEDVIKYLLFRGLMVHF